MLRQADARDRSRAQLSPCRLWRRFRI